MQSLKKRIEVSEYQDVMIDLETLGTRPGCVILSIGAVAFHPESGSVGEEFYRVINRRSCEERDLTTDEDTLSWWSRQAEEARAVIAQAEYRETSVDLEDALTEFSLYLDKFNLEKVRIWGNGADFDNAILAVAYGVCGGRAPWSPWGNRCYRTLKNLVNGPRLRREGTYHNALDDAKSQAQHAVDLLGRLRGDRRSRV